LLEVANSLTGGTNPQAFFIPAELARWGAEASFDAGNTWHEWFDCWHVPLGHRERDGGLPSQYLKAESIAEVIGAQIRLFAVPTFPVALGADVQASNIPDEL